MLTEAAVILFQVAHSHGWGIGAGSWQETSDPLHVGLFNGLFLNILMAWLVFPKGIKEARQKLQCLLRPSLKSHTISSTIFYPFRSALIQCGRRLYIRRQRSLEAMLNTGYHNQLQSALSNSTISYVLTNMQYAILPDLIFNSLIDKKYFLFIFIWLMVRLSIILYILANIYPLLYVSSLHRFVSTGLFDIFLICSTLCVLDRNSLLYALQISSFIMYLVF